MAHAQPPPHRAVRPAAALLVWALIAVGVIAPLAIYRLDRHRDHPGSSSGHRHGHLPAAGQHTRSDVLPLSVRSFSTGAAGWVGAQSGWQRTLGRSGAGALTIGAAGAVGHLGKVESPAFSVTPGARYVATVWARAAQGTSAVAVGLRFYDANGRVIRSARQNAHPLAVTASAWSLAGPAAGIGPKRAVSGRVILTGHGRGGQVIADDVALTATTGVPAPIVGPLTTRGNGVYDGKGRQLTMRGVQLAGLATMDWRPGSISKPEITVMHSWGANFVRIPLAENPAVFGDCSYQPHYIKTVERVVRQVTSVGMVALLDLHSQALGACKSWGPQTMPDDESIRFWQQMATRFRHNPLVAFDLYNEPHGITDSVWRDGGTTTSFGVTYHAVGMLQLYRTIRATGARNLVFIGGPAYATVFSGSAPLPGTTNVVYAAHAYTCPHDIPSRGGDCSGGAGGVLDPSHILDRFVAAGSQLPVFVTEFGWPDPHDGTYVSNVIRFVESHGWVGWAAFVVNGGTRGLFNLVGHVAHYWQPTPVGMAAIAAMTGD